MKVARSMDKKQLANNPLSKIAAIEITFHQEIQLPLHQQPQRAKESRIKVIRMEVKARDQGLQLLFFERQITGHFQGYSKSDYNIYTPYPARFDLSPICRVELSTPVGIDIHTQPLYPPPTLVSFLSLSPTFDDPPAGKSSKSRRSDGSVVLLILLQSSLSTGGLSREWIEEYDSISS